MPPEKTKPHLEVVTMTGLSEPSPKESAFLLGEQVRLLLDVDSVFGNIVQVFISAIMAAGIRKMDPGWLPKQFDIATELGFTKDEEERMYKMLQAPGVANMMHPYPGAVEKVKSLANIADVYFVTTPMQGSPTWTYDRGLWLTRLFGDELGAKWVYTKYKFVVFGDILVDDKAENCYEFEKAWPGSIALRWKPKGREVAKGLKNVDSWDMVRLYVEQYAKKKKLWRKR